MSSPVAVTTAEIVPFVLTPDSLAAAFTQARDPRRMASVTYTLPAMLCLAVSALLANHRSVLAMAEWGARQSPDLLRRLGFPDGRTPGQSTLQRLFAKLDGDALSAALAAHFGSAAHPVSDASDLQGVAIDGKAQRGRLQYERGGCPVHALSAFCQTTGVVLAHEPIDAGGSADKAEAELTVAPALIARIDWHGRVLTGDALFCQRQLCHQVLDAGGDYLLVVKANQPTLLHALKTLFDPDPASDPLPLLDRRETRTIEAGHGRSQEVRHLLASTDLSDYLCHELAWPGVAQVFRVERTWRERGHRKRQVRYGITSVRPDVGSPERLLALKRGHWGIENWLHRGKDVVFGEDQSLTHCGQGATVLALVRDATISLLYRAGLRQVSACLRDLSQRPDAAVDLVVETPRTHA